MRIDPPASLPSQNGTKPGRHRRRAPARRAAGHQLGVARVAGRPIASRLGDRPQPELGRVGLADQDRAGGAQPRDVRRVVVRPPSRRTPRSRAWSAAPRCAARKSLTPNGTAGAAAAGRPGRMAAGRGERALAVDRDERVDLAVARLDRPQRGLDHLRSPRRPERACAAMTAPAHRRSARGRATSVTCASSIATQAAAGAAAIAASRRGCIRSTSAPTIRNAAATRAAATRPLPSASPARATGRPARSRAAPRRSAPAGRRAPRSCPPAPS